MTSGLGSLFQAAQVKRKIFVSYHHGGDQNYYNKFTEVFSDQYEVIYDNSLERAVDSDNPDYVMRRIRENYISGTSCTVVLVGGETPNRKYVDWEIYATLEKLHGLIGLQLPTAKMQGSNVIVPSRLHDNITSGYATWLQWAPTIMYPSHFPATIEAANARAANLIRNDRERMSRNA